MEDVAATIGNGELIRIDFMARSCAMARIRYRPGAISLILLLPACVGYLFAKGAFEDHFCVPLLFEPNGGLEPVDSSSSTLTWAAPVREWIPFRCDGDDVDCAAAIEAFLETSLSLSSRKDTIRGASLSFGPHTKLSSVIRAADITILDTTLTARVSDTTFKVHWQPPVVKDSNLVFVCTHYFVCGTSCLSDELENPFLAQTRELMRYTPSWILLIFLALQAFPIKQTAH